MRGVCVVRGMYTSGFFFSSRRRHTSCALVTGVQTCALPICLREQAPKLKEPFTALIDDRTGAEFGRRGPDAIIELNGRRIGIVGEYHLGMGFLGREIGRESCRERVCQYV